MSSLFFGEQMALPKFEPLTSPCQKSALHATKQDVRQAVKGWWPPSPQRGERDNRYPTRTKMGAGHMLHRVNRIPVGGKDTT